MKILSTLMVAGLGLIGTTLAPPPSLANHEPHLYTMTNMGTSGLLLINTETDKLLHVPLMELEGWSGGMVNHSWVTADGETVYVCTNATATEPSTIVIVGVDIDWEAGTVDATIDKVITLDPPGARSSFPAVQQVDPRQPIADWTQPALLQAHAPTFLPNSPYSYLTNWTDNRVRVMDGDLQEMVPSDPFPFGQTSRQTHGVNFNLSGRWGLGTGYYYDQGMIDVYRANPHTGTPKYIKSIRLGSKKKYAAYTHHTVWLNNRFALTATMQLGPTSLTPQGAEIIGPSVWLLNVPKGEAEMIIGPAKGPNDAGVFRPASDIAVARNKLYIAEEDTLDGTFGNDGFVSIFDITDVKHPVFLKRLKPGVELPADFVVAHTMAVTNDGAFVYVSSYVSNHIIKINTLTDTVAKVFSAADGLDMPHGEFIAGQLR